MRSVDDVRTHLSFLSSLKNTLMFESSRHTNGDSWENILVIENKVPIRPMKRCTWPPGNWTIVVSQDRISTEYLVEPLEG